MEAYNEDVLGSLVAERDRLNKAINEVHDLARHGGKYTAAAKAAAVASIKAVAGPSAKDYKGNPKPPPPPEAPAAP